MGKGSSQGFTSMGNTAGMSAEQIAQAQGSLMNMAQAARSGPKGGKGGRAGALEQMAAMLGQQGGGQAPAQPTTPQASGADQVAQQRADRIAQFNENLRKARESAMASRQGTAAKVAGQ